MGLVVNKEFNALNQMVHDYFRPAGPAMSSGKQAEEKAEARLFGRREGIARCIANVLSEKRIEVYPLIAQANYPWWDSVTQHDVENALKPFAQEFPLPREGAEPIVEKLSKALDEVILGDEVYRTNYAKLRRQLIENGDISPERATDEDREFWKKQYEEQTSRLAAIKKLAGQ